MAATQVNYTHCPKREDSSAFNDGGAPFADKNASNDRATLEVDSPQRRSAAAQASKSKKFEPLRVLNEGKATHRPRKARLHHRQ